MDEAVAASGRAGGTIARPPRRPTLVGVLGELLITAGVVVLLYVVWQLWVGDLIYGWERNATGSSLSEEWAGQSPGPAATPDPTGMAAEAAEPVTAAPPVLPKPADAEIFGVMRIPRFGADYAVPMAGGVTRERTLDPIGVGHYPGTPMPGQPGNFAVAAHRTTWGKPFHRIAELRLGDAIVVETPEGWFTYRFRTLEYVTPTEVDVLLPVPQAMGVPAGTAYITLTSCSPLFAMTERIVAYGVFESFTPRGAGEPSSLQAVT